MASDARYHMVTDNCWRFWCNSLLSNRVSAIPLKQKRELLAESIIDVGVVCMVWYRYVWV